MLRYQIFLRIIENGSFTKTAEEFGYTQSAVSQIVQGLEEELRVTLFTRTKQGIHLTSDGKAIVPYVQKLCDDYDHMLSQSISINNLDGATIRIGAFASVSANFLPKVIKQFMTDYPNVQFKLLQADYETIKLWINEGTVDFGFLTSDVADKLDTEPIFEDEMVMVLPKNHPAVKKKKLTISDFKNDPFIFLDQGKKSEPLAYFTKAGVHPKQQFRVYDDYTIMNMVEEGLGVSILPKLVLLNHHQDITLRSLSPRVYRHVCVAYKNADSLSVAGKIFMNFTVDYAKKLFK